MGYSVTRVKGTGKARLRARRKMRGRKKLFGTSERPRLVVTRSSRHIFAQVIDDTVGNTIASASTMETDMRASTDAKTDKARKVGEILGARAKEAGVEAVIFDRSGHRYHGRVAAVADGAREAGLSL